MNKYSAQCVGYDPLYKDIDFIDITIEAESKTDAEMIAEEKIQYNTSPIEITLIEKNEE